MVIVHAADLHLDSPMKGISAYPGAPSQALRLATRLAFESLVDLALDEHADLVLISGDLYDGDLADFSTALYLRAQLTRLRDAQIPVVMLRGNHDAASVITKQLGLGEGVHLLSHVKPETVVFEKLGVAVHGQSFATRAVTENLAAAYPPPSADMFNIGMLHTSLGGHAEHETYAPCVLADLVAHGYDYWALGHVHERAVLHQEPWVVYPGNLQGRHVRECGPKGATLITVDDRVVSVEHRTLDHARWECLTVDVSDALDDADVLARAEKCLQAAVLSAEDRLLACRIEIVGATDAHSLLVRDQDRLDAELRATATDVAPEQLWVERIIWKTSSPRQMADSEDAIGEMLSIVRAAAGDDVTLARIAEGLRPLTQKLPTELRSGPDGIDPADPATLRRLLGEVERIAPSLLLTEAAS